MRSSAWLVATGLLVLACGGKSDILPADTGGGSGGTSAGGTSSGGTGTGGTTTGGFGGGGFGGGGFGGGGFGGGGFGGTGVGGFGGTGGGMPGLAEQVCAKLDKECPLPSCLQEIGQGMQIAAQNGCANEYQQVLLCALDSPIQCSPSGDPELSPKCDPIVQVFGDCMGGPNTCSVSGGPGSCALDCGFWGAQCWEKPGYLYCTCSYGPNTGQVTTFQNQSCGGNWQQLVEKLCSP